MGGADLESSLPASVSGDRQGAISRRFARPIDARIFGDRPVVPEEECTAASLLPLMVMVTVAEVPSVDLT